MKSNLSLSKREFEETIIERLQNGETIYKNLKKATNINSLHDLKLEYELWDDYNVNYLKTSFTQESNDELTTYNDGIASLELRAALRRNDSPELLRNDLLKKLEKQRTNLLIIKNRIDFFQEANNYSNEISVDDLEFLPIDLVKGSRGYLENIFRQVLLCYKYSLYDSCLVMTRKLLEALIIDCFEKYLIQSKIQDKSGNYYFLSELITKFIEESTWQLTRNTKQALPEIKKVADLSAHNRRFNARKNDMDKLRTDLRIAIEELTHILKQ